MLDTNGLLGSQALAEFIGQGTGQNPGSGTLVLDFSFAAVGDLGVIHAYYPLPGSNNATAAGWNRVTYTWTASNAYLSVYMWKVLDAADVASGVTVTGLAPVQEQVGWAAYRGPTTAAVVSTGADYASATVSAPAFDPHDLHMGAVSILHSRTDQANPTPPAGSTRRAVFTVTSYGTAALADFSDPDAYAGGALVWTGLTGAFDHANVVIELRES